MSNEETHVQIFVEKNGVHKRVAEMAQTVSGLGAAPIPGDIMVDDGVPSGLDRTDPANRTIYRVLSRYFLPHARGADICLVCEERQGSLKEMEILGP